MHKRQPYYLVLLILFISCRAALSPSGAEYANYRVTATVPKDTVVQMLMKPYRDSTNKSMNDIVGRAEITLEKKLPESTLGNFMADAMLYSARVKFSVPIDAAFVNYGGLRINQLPAGPVTRGKIFELMPFDNLLVVQQIKGDMLQLFLNLIAEDKGWPVAGVQFQLSGGKATNIKIGGAPLDLSKTYSIVNSDYVANGGENAAMLKTIPQQNKGYLMRDAIFDYINHLKSGGKNISANIENRVTNAQ
jgi:2',3'-cyclic-nucleotide 2'-phosphodiesterase (5'-nucleotidase family)